MIFTNLCIESTVMVRTSSTKISRVELALIIEAEEFGVQLGWATMTGEEVLTALGIRGLAPPHASARKRTPGSGRSVVYFHEALSWLLELALRVEHHGWAWAREPMLMRRRAVLSDCTLAARADRPLVDIILDRAVCDLLNLQASTAEELSRSSEQLVLCRGALSQGETPLARLLEANRRWSQRSGRPASEALTWGPALVLCPRSENSARAFLGADPKDFTRRQSRWRETLESVFLHGENPSRALADRHDITVREDHHVFARGFPYPILPDSWEAFLRWRLSCLVHRRPQRGAAATLQDIEIPTEALDEVIGMTEDGSFGIRDRAANCVVCLSTAVA